MTERKKVIRGLECHATKGFVACQDCPYYPDELIYEDDDDTEGTICEEKLAADALALLKEQEPRVMTMEELLDVGRVWESSAPPYLWLDKNRSIYNTISFWCAWRDIFEMIHGRHDKYTDENYGSEWRCWTSRPTPEQMRETPWEGDSDAE